MIAEMEYVQIRSLLDRISYKPNVAITCTSSSDECLGSAILHIEMYVPDSTRHHPRHYESVEREIHYSRPFAFNDRTLLESVEYRMPDQALIPVSAARYVPPGLTEDHFLAWLRRVLMDLEAHELDEWLKLDGTVVNNPHDPVKLRLPEAKYVSPEERRPRTW